MFWCFQHQSSSLWFSDRVVNIRQQLRLENHVSPTTKCLIMGYYLSLIWFRNTFLITFPKCSEGKRKKKEFELLHSLIFYVQSNIYWHFLSHFSLILSVFCISWVYSASMTCCMLLSVYMVCVNVIYKYKDLYEFVFDMFIHFKKDKIFGSFTSFTFFLVAGFLI